MIRNNSLTLAKFILYLSIQYFIHWSRRTVSSSLIDWSQCQAVGCDAPVQEQDEIIIQLHQKSNNFIQTNKNKRNNFYHQEYHPLSFNDAPVKAQEDKIFTSSLQLHQNKSNKITTVSSSFIDWSQCQASGGCSALVGKVFILTSSSKQIH